MRTRGPAAGPEGTGTDDAEGGGPAALGAGGQGPPAGDSALDPDMQPRLANPLRSGGRPPSLHWAIGIALLGGLIAAAAVAPLAGLAIGAVLLLGLLVDRSRIVLALGAVGLIALTGVVMARGQLIHGFVLDIIWPSHFPLANSLTWMAICLLAVDAIVVAVRLRSSGHGPVRRPADPRKTRNPRSRRTTRALGGGGGRRGLGELDEAAGEGGDRSGLFSRARPRRRSLTGPARVGGPVATRRWSS